MDTATCANGCWACTLRLAPCSQQGGSRPTGCRCTRAPFGAPGTSRCKFSLDMADANQIAGINGEDPHQGWLRAGLACGLPAPTSKNSPILLTCNASHG